MSKCEFFVSEIEYLGHLVPGKGISSVKQKVKANADLESATNITEAWHMIGLMGYYRKFFPLFSDIIPLLNEWTRKNIPFKWTDQYQKNLDYVKQIITTSPILAYQDPDKQYYLLPDSSKHSWIRNVVQDDEQMKDDATKLNIPHPITYQSGTFQGSQEIWSTLTKEACDLCVILQSGLLFKRCTFYDTVWPHSLMQIYQFSYEKQQGQ